MTRLLHLRGESFIQCKHIRPAFKIFFEQMCGLFYLSHTVILPALVASCSRLMAPSSAINEPRIQKRKRTIHAYAADMGKPGSPVFAKLN